MLVLVFLVARKVTIFKKWMVFCSVLLTSPPSVNTCGHRWAEEPEQWTGYRHFISPSLASRFAQCSPVMQTRLG